MQSQNCVISKNDVEAEVIINNYFSELAIELQEESNQNEHICEDFLIANMFPINNMKCTLLRGAQDTRPRLNCDLRRNHERRNNKKKGKKTENTNTKKKK